MEETSSNTNPVVAVECPSFHSAMISAFEQAMSLIDDNDRKKEIQKLESHYRTLNWITPKLRDEVVRLFPSSEDIDTVNNNQRNVVQFKNNLETFFIPGRFFKSQTIPASPKDTRLKVVCYNLAHQHNTIVCHYNKPDSIKLHPDRNKRCKPRASSSYECPFSFKYYIPGRPRTHAKPRILYHVKLTTVNLTHTRPLNTSSF